MSQDTSSTELLAIASTLFHGISPVWPASVVVIQQEREERWEVYYLLRIREEGPHQIKMPRWRKEGQDE